MHAPECFQYTCFGFSMGQVGFNYATKLWPRAGGGEGEGGGGEIVISATVLANTS